MEYITQLTTLFEFRLFVLFLAFAGVVGFGYYAYLSIHMPYSTQKRAFFISVAAVFVVCYVFATVSMVQRMQKVPRILQTTPTLSTPITSYTDTIRIVFSEPVLYDTIIINSFPQLQYEFVRHEYLWGLLPFGTSLTLKQHTTLPPGETVMLYLSNIEGPLTNGYGGETALNLFISEPEVIATSLKDGADNIHATQPIDVRFSTPIANPMEWQATSVPSHEYTIEQVDSRTLRIHPEGPLLQETAYVISLMYQPKIYSHDTGGVVQFLSKRTLYTIALQTVKPAFLTDFSPQGNNVNPTYDIVLTFDNPMNQRSVEERLHIKPDTIITKTWNSNSDLLSLSHAGLSKDTTYTVTIDAGAQNQSGGTLEQVTHLTFKTAGPLELIGSTPDNHAEIIPFEDPVVLTFNQPVPDTISEYIQIAPDTNVTYSIDGSTLTITPVSGFEQKKEISFLIPIGAPSVYGQNSIKDFSFSFTTASDGILLDIPLYKQQTNFTCNMAAARMLLAFRGIAVSEADLITITGLGGKRGEGNPHTGYIDDFGTFWEPVHKAVSAYNPARLITSGSLSEILTEVKNGNPVMTWGQNGWSDPHDISWTATDGTYIHAINGMHSMVVRGFEGSAENPTAIYVNDPWRGQYTLTKDEFIRRWKYYYVALVLD